MRLGPVTDLYQLTMIAGYFESGMADRVASFEVFVRKLPEGRAFLVFAGLEQAIGDLLKLAFSPEQIAAIARWPAFRDIKRSTIDRLAGLRFEGDVNAVPEGTVVFAGETLIRVTAPLPQAQWVETYLLASLSYPTLVASKAARIVAAAGGRSLYEFGARRGHGPHSGMLAARAAYLAGFDGTSHAEAVRRLGIPASGTMAHSWVQAFASEAEAFEAYARVFPGTTTLLVDTYDTAEGVHRAARIEPPVQGIRIDSGDVESLAFQARAILNAHGRSRVKIMASGDLDEYRIARLVALDAPIDGFGVGSALVTSRDAPTLGMVYKLVEVDGRGTFKLSTGKKTYPMKKQVFRRRDPSGRFCGDLVTRWDETVLGEPLLTPIVRSGRLVGELPSLEAIRVHCQGQRAALPQAILALDSKASYSVTYSDVLEDDARRLMAD